MTSLFDVHVKDDECEWKSIAYRTYRLPVEGGWLYRYDNLTMVFVPVDVRLDSVISLSKVLEKKIAELRDKDAA